MKSILVDLYKIKNLNSGLGQFSLNFANHLAKFASENITLNGLAPNSAQNLLDKRFNKISSNLVNRFFQNNTKYDLWHSLHQFPAHFPNSKSIQILTIHDLNFLKEKSESKNQSYLKKLQNNVDRANFITSISNYTAKEIEKHIDLKGKKVTTIYNGVSINRDSILEKPNYVTSTKFFFSIGIFNKKKNFHELLETVKDLEDTQLIIAGNNNTEYGRKIKNEIKIKGLESKIILPGIISEPDKNWLYDNCEALLFPSIAEGFGLPVIEVMKYGKPVFLSKGGSLPEIGGEHAFYFDSFESNKMIKTILNGMEQVSKNDKLFRQKSQKHGDQFSWENSIKAYLNLYVEILKDA